MDNDTAQRLADALNRHSTVMEQFLNAMGPNGHLTDQMERTRRSLEEHSASLNQHSRALGYY